VESHLQAALEVAKPRVESWRTARQGVLHVHNTFSCFVGAVDPEELVNYGHKISYTTSAPPNWAPDKPLMALRTPAPQVHDPIFLSLYLH